MKSTPVIRRNLISMHFAVVTICLLGVLVYSNTFHSSFYFDDLYNIVSNIAIRDIGNLQFIWHFATHRFITYLSLALNYHFSQLRVFGYHLTNLIIHLSSAVLVWWFVILTFSTPLMKDKEISKHADIIALFSGLLFAAHPVQTQAVTYIVQRAASLATLFYIASLNLYIKARLSADTRTTPSIIGFYYLLSLTTAVLGMFTKEIVFTLPLMILLYEFYFLRIGNSFNWKYLVPFLILLLVIPLTVIATKSSNLWEIGKLIRETETISHGHYLLTQFRVLVTYLRLLFIPLNQNLDYDYHISMSLWEVPTLSSFFLLSFIVIIGIMLFRKYRLISFAIFWFFLTLSVESSVIPIRDVIFKHRLYLPMVGYSLFLPISIYYLCRNKKTRFWLIILFMLVSFYSILAYCRNGVWKSEVSLLTDIIKKSPGKARPYHILGNLWRDRGEQIKALEEYKKAVRIKSYPHLWNDLGTYWLNRGEYDKAKACYKRAIAQDPKFFRAYYAMGLVCEEEKLVEEAILWYKRAIGIEPRMAEAYCNLGNIYYVKGLLNEAEAEYRKAIDSNPYLSQPHYNLGILYENKGLILKSAEEYAKVPLADTEYYSKALSRMEKLQETLLHR